jgi:cation:H+ antiporter
MRFVYLSAVHPRSASASPPPQRQTENPGAAHKALGDTPGACLTPRVTAVVDLLTAPLGAATPWVLVSVFLAASLLMIWRLEHLTQSGMEGTVLGTLVMPYCSGIGNILFVYEVHRQSLPLAGQEVMTNALVNNLTNMTLCIGLPAIIWGTALLPSTKRKAKRKRREDLTHRLNRLSMLLTLLAVLFFTGAVWALTRDARLDFGDGLVLVGLFLFWQCFQVFDVLKSNVRQNRSLPWTLVLDFALLLLGAYAVYVSVQGLVAWLARIESGFISVGNLGWLSGWLMVLPNASLALYYGWKRQPEVIYTSQVGDGHICVPLCVGLAALFYPVSSMPPIFETAVAFLVGAVVIHTLVILSFGQLPRFMGWLLTAVYGYFLYLGLIA